jgi:hypothetical protein
MFAKGIKIHFAHRTFKWKNEAKGQAAVYCIIIGFAKYDANKKKLFTYEDIASESTELLVKNVNPYLIDFEDIVLLTRSKPICDVPEMVWGNKPVDGGYLILSDDEKNDFIKKEPKAEEYIRPLISAKEYLHGEKRWCLWLIDVDPSKLKSMPHVMERIKGVKEMRLSSTDKGARDLANYPYRFRDTRNPKSFILIPSTSSENRNFVPMGFFGSNDIAHNSCHMVPEGELYHFGVLTSTMHMAWMRAVCGRLEGRYRYSNNIVYNNYPWPQEPSEAQKKKVEDAAQAVLDARAAYPNSTLADLYDPLAMPKPLLDAHKKLDAAVDACYRKAPFTSELERLEYLFGMYKELTKDLFTVGKKKGKRGKALE